METLKRVQQEQAIYLTAGAKLFHFSRMHPEEGEHLRKLLSMFSPQPGAFYADFGCGIGTVMRELEEVWGAHTIGINLSPEQSMICLEKGLLIQQGSFTHTKLPENSVDAVLFMETFGYVDPDETLRECRRILKPGGQLWLKDFFFLGTEKHRKDIFKVWRYFFYKAAEFQELFESHGFKFSSQIFMPYVDHYIQMLCMMQSAGIQAFVPSTDAPANAILTGFAHFTGVATCE